MEREATMEAAACGQLDILKYCIEERKIPDRLEGCLMCAAGEGKLSCLKYLFEEAKAPLNITEFVCVARFREYYECENYLLEKGVPEPTEQEYEDFVSYVNGQRTRMGLD